jgi:uncharacterized membrane protein
MLDIVWVALFVVLFIKVSGLSGKVRVLEQQLKNARASVAGQPASGAVPGVVSGAVPAPVQQDPWSVSDPVSAVPLPVPAAPEPDGAFVHWMKENWLSKLGVILILIGFGWFISYAFVHNWIGPVGRVALGMMVGAVLCLLGAWRITKDAVQANVLLVLGSAIVMMTAYAARTVYDFFSPATVLLMSALVAAYITTLALRYNREKLAVYGMIVALVAPLFTHATAPSVIGLYLYLAVVSVVSVCIAIIRGWGSVNVASLAGILVYTSPFVFGLESLTDPEKMSVILLTSLLALMYFVVNIFEIVKSGESIERHAVVIAIGNSILIFAVVTGLVVEEVQSLLFAGWMIVFAAGSLYVSAQLRQQTFFYIYGLVSVLFLGVATAIELSGPVLTIAFMFEAAIITLLTFVMTKKLLNTAFMSLLMIVPGSISLFSLDQYAWGNTLLNEDAFVTLLMAVLLFVLGFFLMHHYKEGVHDERVRGFYVILNCTASLYAFAYIWLGSHAVIPTDMATIVSLAIYTIVGIIAYIQGALVEQHALKKFGSGVLLLVIIRLVLIDVWQMPLAPRIVTFMLIGVLLVSTAFIGRKRGDAQIISKPINHENTQG